MKQIVTHTGIAAPLNRSNIDTDQICAARFLKRITKTGYDDALFAEWREDPDFVLNRPGLAGASILVVGPSFGTGSSREHAVWALRDFGFDVVIGSSFGDIFRGNAGKQGLLLATVTAADAEEIFSFLDRSPAAELTVDLEQQTIRVGERLIPFDVDTHTRHRLLHGLDDIGLTLQHEEDIRRYEARRPSWKPRIDASV